MKTFALLALLLICHTSFGKYVTVTVAQTGPALEATNEVTIAQGEVAEIKSFPFDANLYSHLILQKDNKSFWFSPGSEGLIFTGPAKLLLRVGDRGGYGIATVKIEPEAFAPDKTIVIPAGTGARVTLEYSTNLTQWSALHSVTHTNSAANLFFRIKAERLNSP